MKHQCLLHRYSIVMSIDFNGKILHKYLNFHTALFAASEYSYCFNNIIITMSSVLILKLGSVQTQKDRRLTHLFSRGSSDANAVYLSSRLIVQMVFTQAARKDVMGK